MESSSRVTFWGALNRVSVVRKPRSSPSRRKRRTSVASLGTEKSGWGPLRVVGAGLLAGAVTVLVGAFVRDRIPMFLGYLDRALDSNPAGKGAWLVGRGLCYVDLSTFQIVAGLRYAFPRAMERHERSVPRLATLHDRVAALPRIAAYLASGRRIPFNEAGIFRHYPELDLAPKRAR